MSNKENMEVSENVDVLSDSEKKLRDGLEKVNKIAEIAKDNWEKKKESAGTEFMCNSCGEKFSSAAGVKRHLSSKSCKCDKEKGYKEVTKAIVNNDDRAVFLDSSDISKKQDIAANVTKDLREASKFSSNTNGKKITVVDLTRCPTPSLESMLKQADTSEIKKFVAMRFHPANASRKFMAEKELSKR